MSAPFDILRDRWPPRVELRRGFAPSPKPSRPTSAVQAPLGKTHKDENFPVASRLLSPTLREPVLAFYDFVRQADDIADHPDMSADAKLKRLDALERALETGDGAEPAAARLAAADRRFGAGADEARRMLGAFRQDSVQGRYEEWSDLADYCARSAVPVGRFLLKLHREPAGAVPAADALSTALQILNHLQDARADFERLDRIYLPQSWLAEIGGEEVFFRASELTRRRPLLDSVLDRIDALLAQAACLPDLLRSRRLAMEAAMTIRLAERLSAKLRRQDPISADVRLGRKDFGFAFVSALLGRRRGSDARTALAVVKRSGSSFRLGMSMLDGDGRRGMNAIYAFCRSVDDIADCAAPRPEKARLLAAWRREIASLDRRPSTPVGRELAWASGRFALPVAEIDRIVDGMEADAAERVRITNDAELDLYCRRVAGSVGLLSISVFGVPEAREFALSLGRTLQLVNILRDVEEDARVDRIYVPLDRFGGDPAAPARELVRHRRFAAACQGLADEADAGFSAAENMLRRFDRRALKPAALMMEGYRLTLASMRRRNWLSRPERVRLGWPDRLRLLAQAARAT